MPSLEFEFEVYCARCGAGICTNVSNRARNFSQSAPVIDIEPCETCLAKERDEADNEGYSRGYADGEREAS